MTHNPTTLLHPWRVLLLDRDPQDPRWILATVTTVSDVRPAELDEIGRYTDWPEITRWVRHSVGAPVSLVPLPRASRVWHITPGGRR